jgi:hypothetical protein
METIANEAVGAKGESAHTPTPWVASGNGVHFYGESRVGRCVAIAYNATTPGREEAHANAALIASAVNAHDDLLAALKAVEWSGDYLAADGVSEDACAWCGRRKLLGHVPDCKVAKAIARAENK